ncbi:hypothetical protein RB597_008274 [Gaeumannomyces tritici]
MAGSTHHDSPGLSGRLRDLLHHVFGNQKSPTVYPNAPGNSAKPVPTGLADDIDKLGFKDIDTLLVFLNSAVKGVNDDQKFLLERLIQLLAKLPPASREGKKLTDGLINDLWDSLDHPPVTSLGNGFSFREPDGSNNNIHLPSLGAANTPYARSTKPLVFQNPNPPDPTTIFDTLMVRDPAKFRPHPNKISSMLFYLATIITHDIFQTSPRDFNVNLTSSYLDLSPLYGRNHDEQMAVRTGKDGLLKPDTFSSKRVIGFPPGVGAFLIMFNRFHNYVVTQLAKINEGGRFKRPTRPDDTAGWETYDNSLFQTGRLITCGLYINIVLGDYVRTILNLNRADTSWNLDPRTKEGKSLLSKPTPEAVGNQVSVEFNLIYRWHCTISERDDKWTTDAMREALGGQDPATAKMEDVMRALGMFEKNIPDEPEKRTLAGLTRQSDGAFDDTELVKILQESIEDVAGAFGPNHVPACMRAIEILGIKLSRTWNVATLNEFRQFIGLTPHDTFEHMNPDPKICKILAQMYDSPDAVELYPGIMAEAAKPPISPGSGLCPPYTTSRAILSDAVALVRGDRFYTVDYTPRNITNWGFNEASTDKAVDWGHVTYKLFFRAFPNHFLPNSVYAHFPFVVPSENKLILEGLGAANKYSWDPPKARAPIQFIRSHKAVLEVLSNQKDYKVTWGPAIKMLGGDPAASFALAGDEPANAASRHHVITALTAPKQWRDEVRRFYEVTTRDLLRRHGAPVHGVGAGPRTHEVDVIRDVIGLAHARFMASLFSLPLKEEGKEEGAYGEHELYRSLVTIFAAIFWDSDVCNSLKLHQASKAAADKMGALIAEHVRKMEAGTGFLGALGKLKDLVTGNGVHANGNGVHANGNGVHTNGNGVHANGNGVHTNGNGVHTNGNGVHMNGNGVHMNGNGVPHAAPSLRSFGDQLLQRMLSQGGRSIEETVSGTILPVVMAGTANQTQLLAQCLDYYLGVGEKHLPEMKRLAMLNTSEADEKLLKYTMEGCRIRGCVALYRAVATDQAVDDTIPCIPNKDDPTLARPLSNPQVAESARTLKLPTGTRVLVDLTTASHDPAAFPDPEEVRLDRPLESYVHFGLGPHRCAGEPISQIALSSVMKVLLQLDGLRRVAGPRGDIRSYPASQWPGQAGRPPRDPAWSGLRTFTSADQSAFSPLATTMKINWEGRGDW